MERPEFAKAPLVEAVFDISIIGRAQGPSSQGFFDGLNTYSGEVEKVRQLGVHVSMDNESSSSSVQIEDVGTRRWDSGHARAVLVSAEVLAYNVLNVPQAPYGHFDDHVSELTRLLTRFSELNKPWRVQQVSQRFINHIEISLDDDMAPSTLLTVYPSLKPSHAKTHPPIAVQVEAARFPGGTVFAMLSLPMKNSKVAIYGLEICATTDGDPPTDVDSLIAWHRAAHDASFDVFASSITDVARQRFEEKS